MRGVIVYIINVLIVQFVHCGGVCNIAKSPFKCSLLQYFCVQDVEKLWFWMCVRQVSVLCHFACF